MSSSSDSESDDAADDEIRRQLMSQFYGAKMEDSDRESLAVPNTDRTNTERTNTERTNTGRANTDRTNTDPGDIAVSASEALRDDFGSANAPPSPLQNNMSAHFETDHGNHGDHNTPSKHHNTPSKHGTPSRAGNATDPDGLDSSSFNASSYTLQLLKTSSLSSLLTTIDSLHTATQTLDSTMQTLVYENYSKFITATDAVRVIGSAITNSTGSLDELHGHMKTAGSTSAKIDGDLQPSRSEVAMKLRVRENLLRLSSLLELPETLERMIEERQYVAAAEHYSLAVPILTRHLSAFSSLASIQKRASHVMMGLLARAKQTLVEMSDDFDTSGVIPSTNFALMLAKSCEILGEEGYDKVGCDACRGIMERSVRGAGFLNKLKESGEQFLVCFQDAEQREKGGDVPVMLTAYLSDLSALYLKSREAELFRVCDAVCDTDAEGASIDSGASVVEGVVAVGEEVRKFKKDMESLGVKGGGANGVVRIVDRGDEVVRAVIDRRIAAKYRKLREDVLKVLEDFVDGCAKSKTKSGAASSDPLTLPPLIHDLHHSTILSFASLTSLPIDSLNHSIHGQARTFVLWVASALSQAVGVSVANLIRAEGEGEGENGKGSGGERFRDDRARAETMQHQAAFEEDPFDVDVGALARAADTLRSGGGGASMLLGIADAIRTADVHVSDKCSESIANLLSSCEDLGRSGEVLTDVDMDGAVALRFTRAASDSLQEYVCDMGHRGGQAICVGISDRAGNGGGFTMGEREVREPREGVKLLLSIVKAVSMDCQRAFGGERRAAPASVLVGSQSAVHRQSWVGVEVPSLGGGLAMDVGRMFMENVKVFGGVEFDRESIVVGVFKVALKALIEECRFANFSARGYQQIQVDVTVIRHMLPHYINDVSVVDRQLDDVLLVGAERTGVVTAAVEKGVIMNIVQRFCDREFKAGTQGGDGGCLIWDTDTSGGDGGRGEE